MKEGITIKLSPQQVTELTELYDDYMNYRPCFLSDARAGMMEELMLNVYKRLAARRYVPGNKSYNMRLTQGQAASLFIYLTNRTDDMHIHTVRYVIDKIDREYRYGESEKRIINKINNNNE